MLIFSLLTVSPVAAEEGGRVFTLWPLIDYRSSPETDYRVLHLLGPLFKYEEKGSETEFALRPFLYRASADPGERFTEVLYPVAKKSVDSEQSTWQFLQLLNYRSEPSAAGENREEFTFFPLLFSRRDAEAGNYFALFPLGGKILGRLGRDEIRFTLFPLLAQTRKNDRITDHLLWPIFSRVTGDNESGWGIWPVHGRSRQAGVYRKSYTLWPIFFAEDLKLDSETPSRLRAAFPFYLAEDSAAFSSRTVLWPFFNHRVDHERNYEEWNLPMPLVRLTRGEDRHGYRFLPLIADEQSDGHRKRWFLWPLYKIEETHSDAYRSRRDRVLFFLYSNREETLVADGGPTRKRLDLWPLLSYRRDKNVNHFYLLSLLEPIFPDSPGLERNWSPLWRLYQRKWDDSGNSVSSLLWNLYWREQRGEDRAMEVFPLFHYARETGRGTDLSVLKGLFRYRADGAVRRANFFYLPWPLTWGRENGQGEGE